MRPRSDPGGDRRSRGITFGQTLTLVLLGALAYIGASLWLDSYREHRAEEEVAQVLNSPEAMNAQLDQIADETKLLCQAKGYSERECDKKLSNPGL